MCPYQNSCMMGQQMFHPQMPQWPWSQPAPKSAPKQKKLKVKKPKLTDLFDAALSDLENIKRIRDAYNAYEKAIEENGVKKDKEKKDKEKPKKREGFNNAELAVIVILASPFVWALYKYLGKLLGI